MIKLNNVMKEFNDGSKDVMVLHPTTLTIKEAEFSAIVGPSGSGKSTLLTIMGALQTPTEGTVLIEDEDVSMLTEQALSDLRFHTLGFILQASNLVPYLTIKEQFEMKAKKAQLKDADARIEKLLEKLSITKVKNKYPENVSGGERQRAAIGLALLLKPKVILADEPTASLDTEKAFDVVRLLQKISRDEKTSIVMVTHDQRILSYCDRVYEMTDGVLEEKDMETL